MSVDKYTSEQIKPRWIRARDVAIMLSISVRETYSLCEDGTIPSVRLGKTVRVPIEAFEHWCRERESRGVDEANAPEVAVYGSKARR